MLCCGAWCSHDIVSHDMATMASTKPCKANEPMKPPPFTSDMSTMAIIHNVFGKVPSAILLLQIWPNPPEGAFYGIALLFSFAGTFPSLPSTHSLMRFSASINLAAMRRLRLRKTTKRNLALYLGGGNDAAQLSHL